MSSLIDRIRQRKIIQWSLVYVSAAWLLAQILEVVEGPWNLPATWVRFAHIALAAGLPITAIIAWFHGERGRQRVRTQEVLAVAVVLGVAALAVVFLGSLNTRIASEADDAALEARKSMLRAAGSLPRLAVLAFANLGSPEDNFFADGITEELNSKLSGLRRLAVISRSSASMYRGSDKSARQIGEELGADYVLNGTVRWSESDDGRVDIRVTPALIRVADDTQIWAGQIERNFEEALSVQSEIASRVIAELDVALTLGEEAYIGAPPTSNALAYQTYLKGIHTLPDGHGPEEDYRQARTLLLQAVNLDPGFALAWLALAETDMGLYWFGYDAVPGRLDKARASIERAREVAPHLAEVTMALGDFHYRRRAFDQALAEYATIFDQRPNDSRVLERLGYIWRRQGLFEQALESLENAVALDPLTAYNKLELAWTYLFVDDFERAFELHAQALEVDPSEEWIYLIGAIMHWSRAGEDDLLLARQSLEQFPDARSSYPGWCWIMQHLFEEDPDAALARIRNLTVPALVLQAAYEPIPLLAGSALALTGREEEARTEYQAAVEILEQAVAENPSDFRMHVALGRAYAGLGRREEAIREGLAAVDLMPLTRDALLGIDVLYGLMRIYAILGEDEQALDTMARLLAVPTKFRGFWYTRNPEFASLRDNPRFWSILGG